MLESSNNFIFNASTAFLFGVVASAVSIFIRIAVGNIKDVILLFPRAVKVAFIKEEPRALDRSQGGGEKIIKDLLTVILSGVLLILLLYVTEDGRFRLYVATLFCLGYFLFLKAVGARLERLISSFFAAIRTVSVRILSVPMKILRKPFRKSADLVCGLLHKLPRRKKQKATSDAKS